MAERYIPLNDRLWELEHDLDRVADEGPLSRRLVLRRALTSLERQSFGEGHQAGIRDSSDTRQNEPDHDCPMECCRSAIKAESEKA